MNKIFTFFILAATLLSCAHGKTDTFPTLENPADNAQVFVMRDNNFMGWGFSLKVALDDSIIARLRSGERINFNVKPGFHSLGVSEPTLTVPFEKGHTYYFLISADYTRFGFELHRISDQQAQQWLSKTKPLK
ncbi:hypothetical protein D1AOALGA4SA_150 [Olavius algarvensis Delta 1 endosymbiont]|nr:hypothetical protein D1AOALGA4SA_150 [Olavius algarvensis Delta 1 endosymbiont]